METLKLPVSDFQWLSPGKTRRMTADSILKIAPQGETGYAFKVDLSYPADLHEVEFFCRMRVCGDRFSNFFIAVAR